MLLRIAPGVLAVVAVGVSTVALFLLRGRIPGARFVREASLGTTAAAVVFAVQSGSVGASFDSAILALAAGALAVLLVAFFRSI